MLLFCGQSFDSAILYSIIKIIAMERADNIRSKTVESSIPAQSRNKSVCFVDQPSELPRQSKYTVNPEQSHHLQDIFKEMVSLNRNYLTQKVKISGVKKPSQFQHKMPSRTGNSEYINRYKQSTRNSSLNDMNQSIQKPIGQNNFPQQQVTNMQSSYKVDYSSDKYKEPSSTKSAFVLNRAKFFIDSGAKSVKSSYQLSFDFKQGKPLRGKKGLQSLVMGGKFQGESTYGRNFKSKPYLRTQPTEPVHQQGHKIFVGVANHSQSRYQEAFRGKETKRQALIVPNTNIFPTIQKIKNRSTYQSEYQSKPMQKDSDFDCLTSEQLQNFMMKS